MKNRKTTGLIISIAVALLGTLLLLRYVSASKETAAPAPAAPAVPTRQALVAKQDIPSGSSAEAIAALIETKDIAVDSAQDALISLDPVKGQVTNAQIFAGEPLRPSRFFSPSSAASEAVDPGNVGVSLWLDRTELPDGQIFKDDIVGIVGTFTAKEGEVAPGAATETHLTIRKAKVLSVSAPVIPVAPGAAPAPVATAPGGAPIADPSGKQMITLSVPDVDAERVVYLSKFGTITLIRETGESVEGGTKVINRENIYVPTERRVAPRPAGSPPPAAAGAPTAAGATTTPPAAGAAPAAAAAPATTAKPAAPAAPAAPATAAAPAPAGAAAKK